MSTLAAQLEKVRGQPPALNEGEEMPLSRYNRYFGGEKGSAAKAHAAMIDQYGKEKGEEVFYRTKNKRKSERGGRYKRRHER